MLMANTLKSLASCALELPQGCSEEIGALGTDDAILFALDIVSVGCLDGKAREAPELYDERLTLLAVCIDVVLLIQRPVQPIVTYRYNTRGIRSSVIY